MAVVEGSSENVDRFMRDHWPISPKGDDELSRPYIDSKTSELVRQVQDIVHASPAVLLGERGRMITLYGRTPTYCIKYDSIMNELKMRDRRYNADNTPEELMSGTGK